MSDRIPFDVQIDGGYLRLSLHGTVRRQGTILARKDRPQGEEIYLDRRIHVRGDKFEGGWTVRGAVVSVFTRQLKGVK